MQPSLTNVLEERLLQLLMDRQIVKIPHARCCLKGNPYVFGPGKHQNAVRYHPALKHQRCVIDDTHIRINATTVGQCPIARKDQIQTCKGLELGADDQRDIHIAKGVVCPVTLDPYKYAS